MLGGEIMFCDAKEKKLWAPRDPYQCRGGNESDKCGEVLLWSTERIIIAILKFWILLKYLVIL